MSTTRRSLAAVAAASLLFAACGDDDTTSTDTAAAETSPPATSGSGTRGDYGSNADTTSGDAAAGDAEIVISGFAFSDDITVPVGTTVVVRNEDGSGHTWTADDGAFDSGRIDGGATFEFTFTEAGTFAFHCEVHPSMKGTVTVTP